jgi:hypothetical protein
MMHIHRLNEKTWRRIGVFMIHDAEKTPARIGEMFAIMQNFYIVSAVYDYCWGGVEYTAISPLFDIVPDGFRAPRYDINVNALTADNVIVSATKVVE